MIAHKREDGQIQTIPEHLEGTAVLAEEFASKFGAGELGHLAGMAHDIGKYSEDFQKRILENGPKVDHSSAGAYECAIRGLNPAAFSVAGHHTGLPDLGGKDDVEEGTLRGKLNRAKKKMIPDCSAWKEEIDLSSPSLPVFDGRNTNLEAGFFTRMLFSCLVDADFLDTERFMQPDVSRGGGFADIKELNERLDRYIQPWFPPKGALNEKRCEILRACIAKGADTQGLFTLTVPTGGGKTIASLAFALRHALEHKLDRVIYVVPYTSIIEQTADVFRTVLGPENVLEHHSAAEYDTADDSDESAAGIKLAAENWNAPVIVTTAVQFFESLYASKTSACRKLHNIVSSVVVFDEAQMLPVPFLRPCVFAIAELVRRYLVSAVLCTATQPSLNDQFRSFLPQEPLSTISAACAGTNGSSMIAINNRAMHLLICLTEQPPNRIIQYPNNHM